MQDGDCDKTTEDSRRDSNIIRDHDKYIFRGLRRAADAGIRSGAAIRLEESFGKKYTFIDYINYHKTLIENAKKTKELADANKELGNGMDELISKYDKMNASGQNTSDILSDIQSKMPELIQSYRDLSDQANLGLDGKIDELERLGNLAILTGDYSDFNEKKQSLDTTIAKETTVIAKSGAQAAGTKLAAGMQDTQGKVKGSSYTLTVGGADSGGKTSGEETKAIKILEDKMGDYANSKNDSWGKEGIKLTVDDYTNPLELVDYYEKMVQARDEMARTMTEEEKKAAVEASTNYYKNADKSGSLASKAAMVAKFNEKTKK